MKHDLTETKASVVLETINIKTIFYFKSFKKCSYAKIGSTNLKNQKGFARKLNR